METNHPDFRIYIGEVIDNNDPDQNDKIQVFVSAIHVEDARSNSPWARPFLILGGGGANQGSSWIPEVGDKVWVFFQRPDINQDAFYLPAPNFNTSNTISAYSSIKSSLGESGAISDYPDVKFFSTPNGNIIGMSSDPSNPEVFLYSNSGSSILLESNGNIYTKSSSGKITVTNSTGIYEIDTSGTHTINNGTTSGVKFTELNTGFENLKTQIDAETTKIAAAINAIAPGSYTPTPMSATITASEVDKLKLP